MPTLVRVSYAVIFLGAMALVLASAYATAPGGERWYARGYYNNWSNGVSGSISTYANTPSDVNHFTAIFIAIIFPDGDWFEVGYYQGGGIVCGLQYFPTWYTDQQAFGQYGCTPITNRFPSTGTDYPYQIYDVPGTSQWNGVINNGLVKTTTFGYSYGYGHAVGEANGDGNQMNGWFKSMQYGRIRGGTVIYWYDWASLSTYQDYPYYVTPISSKEFKTASWTHP
ncbi:MAG TPA: hypothetical protein HA326_08440 [Thermoplasmata archaeon]|nr:hypothetical protein [Thermoplasmata archaeon]